MPEHCTVNRYYLREHAFEMPRTLGPNSLPVSTPTGYVLLQKEEGARIPYSYFWDENDRVIYLHRLRHDGKPDPLRLAMRITDEVSLGEVLALRNATRKEGKAPFRPYGTLVAIIARHKSATRAMTVTFTLAMQMLELAMNEAGPPTVTRRFLPPGVTEYTLLTAKDLKQRGFFYVTVRGQVFSYTLDQSTGLGVLEELIESKKAPRKAVYLTRHPSTLAVSPARGHDGNRRPPKGPFEHIIHSDAEMTANEVRTLLGLAGRHQTQPRRSPATR